MSEFSGLRLESRILESISLMIVKGMIKNPNLSPFTSITEVKLDSDNTAAIVYVSCVLDKDLDKSVKALNSAAGFIQSHLGRLLKTRNTPILQFRPDRTQQESEKMNRLINKALGKDE